MINASFWTMVVLQTIGSVDMPGSGERKMPAPRNYVAIIVAWSVLQLFSDTGHEREAGIASWVIVLTGAVIGPFGQRAVTFLNGVAKNFAITPTTTGNTS